MTEPADRDRPDREPSDREYWNRRYSEGSWPDAPSPWLEQNADLLGEPGCALDVAGGTGRNALWLAQRGWDTTIIDVSDVALAMAKARAETPDVPLRTHLADLSVEAVPEGPWDLILIFHYLDKILLSDFAAVLKPTGLLIGVLATVTNLERNERPSRRHLIGNGELPGLLGSLELLRYEEGWQDDHHDARFVARREDAVHVG